MRHGFKGIVAGLMVLAAPVAAHHGWSWAEGDQVRLDGLIEEVSMNPPHPSLRVRAADGTVWFVELGNPGRTSAAVADRIPRHELVRDVVRRGGAVTVIGNRDRDPAEAHMKAVRIVIDGRNYDMYPERIQAD